MRNRPFRFCMGDINYLDYGGTWYRHLPGTEPGTTFRYHFIEVINWEEACGRDAPPEKYNVSLAEVNLSQISNEQRRSALECCGQQSETDPRWIAYSCYSYGLKAPLFQVDGNNFRAMFRQCAAESTRIETDSIYRFKALNRKVNALGSTAAEFMRGDLDSALMRGIKARDKNALLVAKISGIRIPEEK